MLGSQEIKNLEAIKAEFNAYQADNSFAHESWVLLALEEAIAGVEAGSFGVGSILVNAEGKVVSQGYNTMHSGAWRSDMHAEMNVINMFEDEQKQQIDLSGYTLISTFEPCPMCTLRSISAQIGTVLYAALDIGGGRAASLDQLPPDWYNYSLALNQTFAQADCSSTLKDLCLDIWNVIGHNSKSVD
jgi:tRNA(Arg) A34 adenosine deaminase TadA